ncbi:MAG: hypothetical protein H7A45_18110 [Verrucomicrobiales bacterium]|nr:hypothetical protein [Verrucomicrobiales bacterium]
MNSWLDSHPLHLWLLKSSAQAALLVGVVLLIQWLGRRRLSPRWRHALWWLVAIRLLLPVLPESGFSLFNWARWRPAPETTGISVVPPVAFLVQSAHSLAAHKPPARPEMTEPAFVPVPAAVATSGPSSPSETTASVVRQTPLLVPPMDASKAGPDWPTILALVWLAGVVVLAGRLAMVSLRLRRTLRQARRLEDAATLDLLEAAREQMQVHSRLSVWETPAVDGPALCGLLRPRLLLPPGFTSQFAARDLRFVFLHELAHLKRHDIAVNWLTTLLQVLHWFNPFVWFAFRRMRADCEPACDALALRAAGDGEQHAYGETIIKLLQGVARPAALPGMLGILEDHAQMRHRVRMIARYRPTRNQTGLAIVCGTLLGCLCLTDAQSPTPASPAAAANSEANDALGKESGEDAEIRIGADPLPVNGATTLPTRSLTVRVIADASEKPIAGAEVSCPLGLGIPPFSVRRLTDDAGRFVLQFTEPTGEADRGMTAVTLSVHHAGFADRGMMWTSASGEVLTGLPTEVTVRLESGITIGGAVLDERGNALSDVEVALAGSGSRGFQLSQAEDHQVQEYPLVGLFTKAGAAAVTDANGRWSFPDFPGDLESLQVTLIRPDGSRTSFATNPDAWGFAGYPEVSLEALRQKNAVLTLPDGLTVRGIVVDEDGNPLGGVTLKEGYGHGNIERVSETTTGPDGRFERPHRTPRQWIYTASRPDRATVSVVAQVASGMPEVRLVLPVAQPLRLRVVDTAGQPLSGVEFRIDSARTEAQLLDWTGTSDAEGSVVWENPPTAPVVLLASSKALGVARKFRTTPGTSEHTIELNPEAALRITVKGVAVDAVTGEPVELRRVAADYRRSQVLFDTPVESNGNAFQIVLEQGRFEPGFHPSYSLQIQADGYEATTTRVFDFDEGNQDLRIALTPMSLGSRLRVTLPSGEPAAGAKVWTKQSPNEMGLYLQAPGKYYADRLGRAEADEDGLVTLPSSPAESAVVITHAEGFLDGTWTDLRKRSEVRLKPYGAVEGCLFVAGEPKAGVPVVLNTLAWSPGLGFQVHYNATTADDGTFRFSGVPAGEYKLWRWQPSASAPMGGRAITETWQWPLIVRPGETNHVTYAFNGRRVIGQLISQPAGLAVDWRYDDQILARKLPPLSVPTRPNPEDFATFEAFRTANQASLDTGTQVEKARRERNYQLDLEADGSFGIEDVTPGTYELRIHLTKPNPNPQPTAFGRPEEELGSLTREIVIPEGDSPLDLGAIAVPLKPDPGLTAAAPVELNGTTLSGEPIQLSSVPATARVLIFWAAWSDRSREALNELKALRDETRNETGLAFVGINLDDDRDAAAKATRDAGCDWLQICLDAGQRGEVIANLDLSRLPTIMLLGTSGRIVNRDLPVQRLQPAIERLLHP